MTRYDYKVINTDAELAGLRRGAIYVILLAAVIATALVILFILFELYLRLIICGAIYALCFIGSAAIGRIPTQYEYSFAENALTVTGKYSKTAVFKLKNLEIQKNADNSAFLSKNTTKFTFIHSNIVMKSALNNKSFEAVNYLTSYDGKLYLLSLDGYAMMLVKGAKGENDIL